MRPSVLPHDQIVFTTTMNVDAEPSSRPSATFGSDIWRVFFDPVDRFVQALTKPRVPIDGGIKRVLGRWNELLPVQLRPCLIVFARMVDPPWDDGKQVVDGRQASRSILVPICRKLKPRRVNQRFRYTLILR